MANNPVELLWLSAEQTISFSELVEISGLAEAEFRELVDNGVFVPQDPNAEYWTFSASCVSTARTACRLRKDLDLDSHGVAIVLSLLERICELETQLQATRAAMKIF